ncbi:ABC transporter substrate-binding protein [Neobacillus sp. D3-1R]|uniref:ABC transporter substrate-binding protein n=1 Tax=Neobacillus sp. D3-1R TaxID=3445778 RepID=UPI003FA0EC4F
MKKWFTLFLSILLIFSLAACNTKTSSKEGTIKIGVNLELSGPAAVWGVPQKDAIQMLVDQINDDGGIDGKKIELVVYDNESSETQSLVVTKKLVEQDKVVAVIGGGTTPTTMPLLPYIEKSKVPLVSIGSGDAISSPAEERHWVFKTPVDNEDISTSIVELLKKENKKNIAFMALNNAYGDSGLKTFEGVAKANGINIVAVEKFGMGDKDMKPQLTKIKGLNPDAIIVWSIPPAASIVNRNYWELKMDNMLIYPAGAGSNAFVELAGKEAAEGTYVSAGKVWVSDQIGDGDVQKEIITKYVKDFEAKTKQGASPIDGMAYDAMLLISKAIEKSGDKVTRDSIRDNLEKLENVVGVTGVFNLSEKDHQGLSSADALMVQVKNGDWVIPE